MELLTPLPDVMERTLLNEAQAARLGVDICTALTVCRRNSIVHRDIKPENIFLNAQGDYKLGDFGVARTMERMTVGFTRTGTYSYMAPEIFNDTLENTDIDAAAKVDIYSLGMVLYVLTNGNRIPFTPTDAMLTPEIKSAAVSRRMRGEPLKPSGKSWREQEEVIFSGKGRRLLKKPPPLPQPPTPPSRLFNGESPGPSSDWGFFLSFGSGVISRLLRSQQEPCSLSSQA
jgi:serine/threonine protein kinase